MWINQYEAQYKNSLLSQYRCQQNNYIHLDYLTNVAILSLHTLNSLLCVYKMIYIIYEVCWISNETNFIGWGATLIKTQQSNVCFSEFLLRPVILTNYKCVWLSVIWKNNNIELSNSVNRFLLKKGLILWYQSSLTLLMWVLVTIFFSKTKTQLSSLFENGWEHSASCANQLKTAQIMQILWR